MKTDLYCVLRNVALGDCTNHGITSTIDSGIMFWDCSREEALDYCSLKKINPSECFFLVRRSMWDEDHSYAEPLIKPKNSGAQTMGGNFIYTSNNASFKFNGESCTRPIPVHDRFESLDVYYAMSI